MFRTESVIDTSATPAEAFDHIGRGFFENHPRWDPMVVSMEKTSEGPIGAGTSGTETRAVGGRRLVNEIRVVDFEPDSRFGFEATSGPLRERMLCTIQPEGQGSRITVELTFRAATPWMRMLEPVMRPMIKRNVRRNMELLRRAIEGGRNG